jgi:XTP/dITP diphosphohydrolase
MSRLLIATNNQGKVKELQALLKNLNVQLVTPADIHLTLDVIEDGNTYQENAGKKAIQFAQASGLISLADDSGLEVDALDGAPGLYSARYSPPLTLPPFSVKMGAEGYTDKDRRNYLLENLRDKPKAWKAHFHATIAIAFWSQEARHLTVQKQASELHNAGLHIEFAEGNCYGEIISEERGTNGFGYDPIFLFPELNKTMSELDDEHKNRISHRGLAVMNAMKILEKLYS